MSEKIEGTIVLSGLVEGRLPGEEVGQAELRDWVNFVRKSGLLFELEIDGNAFSLMPNESPIDAQKLAPDAAQTIAEAFDQLLKLFPPNAPSLPFSTLRSVEYTRGKETQTLYAVQGDRTVDYQQRTVDAVTTAPEAPLSTKERLKLAGMGLVAAVAVLGITSLFVDYGVLWQRLRSAVTPIDVEAVEVDATVFAPYITVQSITKKKGGGGLVVSLQRTAAYPRNDAAVDAMASQKDLTFTEHMALQAIARGYIRCELYDEKGKYINASMLRVHALRRVAILEVKIPISASIRPARIVLRY